MRKLTERQARACEEALYPTCKCRFRIYKRIADDLERIIEGRGTP